MQLEMFNFIKETGDLLESRYEELQKVENVLDGFFINAFLSKDYFIDIKSRVKETKSLKEKILRNNLFIQFNNPEALISGLSDLIGVRIECRFIDDERRIYNEIVNLFRVKTESGYYTSAINDSILLNLDEKQPTLQKNGFEIYKIDGKVLYDGNAYNFELQIKSLVNVFWGDIDHKILYKNFNYTLTERFLTEIMSSIKENLEMIDRELMMLYNHMNESKLNINEGIKRDISMILSKSLHDVYHLKVKNELGFTVDFKAACNTIISYIFLKAPDRDDFYVNEFIRVMNRLRFLDTKYLDITEKLLFPIEEKFNDRFTGYVGKKLSEIIDKDFNWYLFFKILFDIEEGKRNEVISDFLDFIKSRYYEVINVALSNRELSDKIRSEIIEHTMQLIAKQFDTSNSFDMILEDSLKKVHIIITASLNETTDMWNVNEILDTITRNFEMKF